MAFPKTLELSQSVFPSNHVVSNNSRSQTTFLDCPSQFFNSYEGLEVVRDSLNMGY